MKKINKIAILFIVIIGCVLALFMYREHNKKMLDEQLELEILYRRQNQSLGMCQGHLADRTYYHGADEIDQAYLLVATIVYNSDQANYILSEEVVVTYLSSEYDEEGKLRVYNKPEELDDYIEWWFHGGDEKIDDYYRKIDKYLLDNNYPENIYDISNEKLVEVIHLYEEENKQP